MIDCVAGIINALASRDNSAPGDYFLDGVLMCGKCHTPKQSLQNIPVFPVKYDSDGNIIMEDKLVPVACQCRREEQEREKEADRQYQFQEWLARQSEKYNLSDRAYRTMTFERDDQRSPQISRMCRRYVGQWREMEENNMGILFYGTVGTGKSFYACAIANALLQKRVPALITSFPTIMNIIQGTWEKQDCINHLQRFRLLVIDDLGVERDGSYSREQMFSVIDARYRSGLPLIVTTNLTMDELEKPSDMNDSRIYDRILEMCPIKVQVLGESRRAGNAASRKALAKEFLSRA